MFRLALALTLAGSAAAAPPDLLDKDPLGRLSSTLYRLTRAHDENRAPGRRDAIHVHSRGDVAVIAELRSEGSAPAVAAFVASHGGRDVATAAALLRADLPLSALRAVSRHPDVVRLRLPQRPEPAAIVSSGVAMMGAEAFRQRTGADGTGVKVGILDGDFRYLDRARAAELPGEVILTDSVQSYPDAEGDYGHGTACAEIVRDMAPGATLVLARIRDEVGFLQAVEQLQAQGVHVISASISYPNVEAPDGLGYYAWYADRAALQATWINSAGNYAEAHHESVATDVDGDGRVELGGTEMLPLEVPAGRSWVSIRWDEVRAQAGDDYDLLVVTDEFAANPATTADNPAVVAVSADVQDGDDWPFERADLESEERRRLYAVVVKKSPGALPPGRRFSVMTRGRIDPAYLTPAMSISTPADGRRVLAVAAIDSASGGLRGYSSRGPTQDGRVKPDLGGPDGVDTLTLGLFTGTSAAAPHVAGAAALILSREPGLSPTALRERLLTAAGAPTAIPNNDVGYGLVNLDRLP